MEREGEEEKKKEGSYRYWVREATSDAAPPPLPQKLTNNDVVAPNAPALGSLWNQVLLYSFSSLNFLLYHSLHLFSCFLRLALGRRKISLNGPLID